LAENFVVSRHRPADQLGDTQADPRKNKTPHRTKKLNFCHRTSGTFGFARHTSRPFAKPKEPLFTYAPETAETNSSTFVEPLLKNYFRKSLVIRKLCLLL
jgi:hypothetical protein